MKKFKVPVIVTVLITVVSVFFVYGFGHNANRYKSAEVKVQQDQLVSAADVKLLQNVLLKHGMLFGSLLGPRDIAQLPPRPDNYLAEVAKYFNFYTMSVAFGTLEPKQGVFNFNYADKAVEFAMANHAKMKGHVLVTAGSLPKWLTDGNFTPDQLKDILKNHIETVVSHFKDKYPGEVIDWNVVNEPMCNGDRLNPNECSPGGVKQIIWSAIHKPGSDDPTDYIQYAFEWAHEADPSAKLFINENGIGYISNPKIDRFYDMVKSLVDKHVPINGIGFESHVRSYESDRFSSEALTATMNRFARLGLESQVSEMDDMIASGYQRVASGPTAQIPLDNVQQSDFQQQAEVYKMFLDACLRAKNCTGFTTWGPWDKTSYVNMHWQGNFYPHLLDDNMQPKLAFKYLVDEAKEFDR